ncbi:MAG: phosphotransferase [Peptococcaceae bacterium]|jgi:Ser/Thr protein kinase RdoA (MazF antagonist)|nr:phosphotransferase [Peptococcaceae bacterium]
MKNRQMLDSLNAEYPIRFDGIEPLRDEGGSASFILRCGKTRYFVKRGKSGYSDTFASSADVVHYLNKREFPTPRIILTKSEASSCSANDDMYIVFDYISGTDVDNTDCPEQIGELLGRLHSVGKEYPGKLLKRGREYFVERYIRFIEKTDVSERTISALSDYGAALWERVEKLPLGFSHGDCHADNLLCRDGELILLDFDSAAIAFHSFDVAIMCDATNYFLFDPDKAARSHELLLRFADGYVKHSELSQTEIDAFFDLIALRHFQLQPIVYENTGAPVNPGYIDSQLDWLIKLRKYSGW